MKGIPKAAILMFSQTSREARVMRQSMALRGHYELTVLGMGRNPFEGDPSVRFVELPEDARSLPAKLLRRGALYATLLGGLVPGMDVWRHSRRPCWQQAFTWLEKAYNEHHPDFIELKIEPALDNLHDDSRFADLLRRVGLE